MQVLVLKNFAYSADGLTSKIMRQGETVEIKDEAIEGLEKEGFIVVDLPDEPPGYEGMTKAELEGIAKERGLETKGLNKKEIADLLTQADSTPPET